MQALTSSQASPEVPINENFTLLEHQQTYGFRASGSSGLTWAYWGGRWSGAAITQSTLTLTANSTCYIVVLRSSGAISFSTATTNWNNQLDYARVYSVVMGASTVTSYVDFRSGTGGVHGPAVGMYQFAQSVNPQTGTTYTVVSADNSKLISVNSATACTITLPIASSFTSIFWFEIQNIGAGTVTINPTTSTLDGVVTLSLITGQGVKIVSNGTNYFTFRGASPGGTGAAVNAVNVFTKNQSISPAILTSGASIAVDASQSNNFRLVLGINAVLANPTNLNDGTTINFRIKQDSTGSRTLSYGSLYKFPGSAIPVLSTAANAVDFLSCYYDTTDNTLSCNLLKTFG